MSLDNEFLGSLGGEPVSTRWGIASRGSCLTPSWIRETKNRDPWATHHASAMKPTDLSLRAARTALERAGLEAESLTLSVGDIVTPWESTPAEGQRVASRLGLKIPAYDITSGPGSMALHLHTFSQWREEARSGTLLSVSANVPTQFIDYERGPEREILGDGACALICSSARRGKLAVRKTAVRVLPERREAVQITMFGYATVNVDFIDNLLPAILKSEVQQALASDGISCDTTIFIGPQLSAPLLHSVGAECGFKSENIWMNLGSRGYQLGASEMSVLADRWTEIPSGFTILLVTVGSGGMVGRVVLDVV